MICNLEYFRINRLLIRFVMVIFAFSTLLHSDFVSAQTYRYKVNKRSMVSLECDVDGKKELSRFKLIIPSAQKSSQLVVARLRVRVCSSFGFISYSPRLVVPSRFLHQMEYGNGFRNFELGFSSSMMTAIDGRSANKVITKDHGTSPGKIQGVSLNHRDVHWVELEWKNGNRKVFGPVLLGFKSSGTVRAKGYKKSRHVPVQFVYIKKDGRWVSGTLNSIK